MRCASRLNGAHTYPVGHRADERRRGLPAVVQQRADGIAGLQTARMPALAPGAMPAGRGRRTCTSVRSPARSGTAASSLADVPASTSCSVTGGRLRRSSARVRTLRRRQSRPVALFTFAPACASATMLREVIAEDVVDRRECAPESVARSA